MNNNCILTIEPSKRRRIIEYVWFSYSFLYTIALLVFMIFIIAVTIDNFIKLASNFNVLFCFVNILFLIALVIMGRSLFLHIKCLRLIRSLSKTKIKFYDDYIEFTNNKGFQHRINNSQISYVFAWQRKITIIFENEKLLFFDFLKSVYGDRSFNDIKEHFKQSDKYTDDYKKIKQIIEDNKLRKLIFSTQNSFAYIIFKNS
jgi:hypothetical protein